jgi:hypothetical protein
MMLAAFLGRILPVEDLPSLLDYSLLLFLLLLSYPVLSILFMKVALKREAGLITDCLIFELEAGRRQLALVVAPKLPSAALQKPFIMVELLNETTPCKSMVIFLFLRFV